VMPYDKKISEPAVWEPDNTSRVQTLPSHETMHWECPTGWHPEWPKTIGSFTVQTWDDPPVCVSDKPTGSE
jgi:hypothetical protein